MQRFHVSALLIIFELFIATNSPDDSLLLSWVYSDSLPSDSDKLSISTLLSVLHLLQGVVTYASPVEAFATAIKNLDR